MARDAPDNQEATLGCNAVQISTFDRLFIKLDLSDRPGSSLVQPERGASMPFLS